MGLDAFVENLTRLRDAVCRVVRVEIVMVRERKIRVRMRCLLGQLDETK